MILLAADKKRNIQVWTCFDVTSKLWGLYSDINAEEFIGEVSNLKEGKTFAQDYFRYWF